MAGELVPCSVRRTSSPAVELPHGDANELVLADRAHLVGRDLKAATIARQLRLIQLRAVRKRELR